MQYTWRMELLKRVWECEASAILSLLLTPFPRRYLSSFLSVCVRQSRPSYQLSKESRHLKSIKETLHWTSAKGTINLNSLSSKLHSKAKSLLSTMHWDSINFVLRPLGITQLGKGAFLQMKRKPSALENCAAMPFFQSLSKLDLPFFTCFLWSNKNRFLVLSCGFLLVNIDICFSL